MIGVEKIGEIRRAYFEQHRSIKEIVRTLSVSRATVRKVKRLGRGIPALFTGLRRGRGGGPAETD
jgi:DNA invertase Pin-like site-specific DNA recombinase